MTEHHQKDFAVLFQELEARLKQRYYGWSGREQFNGTGDRLTRAFEEFFWTNEKITKELDKHLSTDFNDAYDEMLVVGPTIVWTLCPHHLLPCKFKVFIGYIPDELILGLSKLPRVAETLARRPVIQEMFTREVADILQKRINPKGVGVYVLGEHQCMQARGVKQNGSTCATSALTGAMYYNPATRAEFFSIVKERS